MQILLDSKHPNDGYRMVDGLFMKRLSYISPDAIKVYLVIYSHVNMKKGDMKSFPSRMRIADECGFSRKSKNRLTTAINELETLRFIRKTRSWNEQAKQFDNNVYELTGETDDKDFLECVRVWTGIQNDIRAYNRKRKKKKSKG